jgi:acyl-CoA thioester hydrolase
VTARHAGRLALRWSDTDKLGHVNAARYVTFIEELCVEWLDFLREVPHGSRWVDAEAWVEEIGTSSFTFMAEIRREDGEPAVRARSVAVLWNPVERRSRPMTDGERAFFQGRS